MAERGGTYLFSQLYQLHHESTGGRRERAGEWRKDKGKQRGEERGERERRKKTTWQEISRVAWVRN